MSRRNSLFAGWLIAWSLVANPATAASPMPSLSTPLSISPTLQKSTLSPTISGSQPFLAVKPVLTDFSPHPCANPGQPLRLIGNNLGSSSGRHLVMDTGQGQFTLAIDAWTTTQIRTRLPANFSHQGKVSVGIGSASGLLGLPLTVPICSAPALSAPLKSSAIVSPLVPSLPALNPGPETANSPAVPDTSDTGNATAPSSPPAADYLPSTNSGSLLGTALAPVPEGLNLASSDQGSQAFAPHELVAVTASMADAQRLQQLMMQGFQARVVRRRKLGSLGIVLSAFRLPDAVSATEALSNIRQEYPDLWVDVNHYFHPMAAAASERTALYRAIGRKAGERCGRGLRIGLLDGPVALDHPVLRGQAIKQNLIFARGRQAASTDHATALASLLVGNPAMAGLGGVVSEAKLFVGVVMQQGKDNDSYSTAADILTGLNWLLGQPVQVVSLSLGGPRNALLEVALQRTLSLGIGVVAAAGNGGADAPPSYPAAQDGVLAVTSVDSDGRVAKDASRGDYIDLAAPGVDVWVASARSGGRYASGTSMAAPMVAAALAQLGGRPTVATELFHRARDLGASGKDAVYGWGLLQFPDCADH